MDDTSMHELDLRPSEVKEWPILSYGIKSLGVPNSRVTKKKGDNRILLGFSTPPRFLASIIYIPHFSYCSYFRLLMLLVTSKNYDTPMLCKFGMLFGILCSSNLYLVGLGFIPAFVIICRWVDLAIGLALD